jgi:hypothetical protein
MKQLFRLLVVILLVPGFVAAQAPKEPGRWSVGIAGGPLFNQIQGSTPLFQYSNKTGYQAGASLTYRIGESFSLRAELMADYRSFGSSLYSQGLRETDTSRYVCWDCYYDYNIRFFTHYLTLPVVFEYSQELKYMGIAFRAGGYYSVLVSAAHEGYEAFYLDPHGTKPFTLIDFTPGFYRSHYTGLVDDVINTYDAGLSIGVGLWRQVGKSVKIEADVSMRLGFANVFENPLMPEIMHRHAVVKLGLVRQISTK